MWLCWPEKSKHFFHDMKIVNANSKPALKLDEIHAWLFDLDDPRQNPSVWDKILSEEEVGRSRHYHFEKDRLRFIIRRGILRKLLGLYTGLEPSAIAYKTNSHGKLSLISHPLQFNLSSCQNQCVFAFTMEKEVGVDIEQVRPLSDLPRLLECWVSPEERAGLCAQAPAVQLEAFYHVWTQKEAFIKASGEGLTVSLKNFSVSIYPNEPGRLLSINCGSDDASHWKMASYVPEAGWRVAVCVRAETNLKVLWYKPDPVDFQHIVAYGKSSLSI
jgi:4'-phosphopantetheinyl transferase